MVLRMNRKRLYQKLKPSAFVTISVNRAHLSAWNQQLTIPKMANLPTSWPETVEVGLVIICGKLLRIAAAAALAAILLTGLVPGASPSGAQVAHRLWGRTSAGSRRQRHRPQLAAGDPVFGGEVEV